MPAQPAIPIPIPIPTEPGARRLQLLQLVSPALPVGASAIPRAWRCWCKPNGSPALAICAAGWRPSSTGVRSRSRRRPWARCRWPCVDGATGEREQDRLSAASAQAELIDLDGWLLALREAPELRAQQRQMGRSLLQLVAELGWPLPSSPAPRLAWPAAWAWAGLVLELGQLELLEAYLYSWVANQVSAAVRLIPLGPTQGQRLQLALAAPLARRAGELIGVDPRSLWSGGVGLGMAQLGHAELYSRLFRS